MGNQHSNQRDAYANPFSNASLSRRSSEDNAFLAGLNPTTAYNSSNSGYQRSSAQYTPSNSSAAAIRSGTAVNDGRMGRDRSDSLGSVSSAGHQSNSTRSRANSQSSASGTVPSVPLTPIVPPTAGSSRRRTSPGHKEFKVPEAPVVFVGPESEGAPQIKLAFPSPGQADLPGQAPPPIPILEDQEHEQSVERRKRDSDSEMSWTPEDAIPTRTIVLEPAGATPVVKPSNVPAQPLDIPGGPRVKPVDSETSFMEQDETMLPRPPSSRRGSRSEEAEKVAFPSYNVDVKPEEDVSHLVQRILMEKMDTEPSSGGTSGSLMASLRWVQEQGAKLLGGEKKSKLEQAEHLVKEYCQKKHVDYTPEHAEAVALFVANLNQAELPPSPPKDHGFANAMVRPSKYRNTASIVHGYGPKGLGMAPLTQDKKTQVIPVILSWSGGGKHVFVTGSFNDWKQKVRLNKSQEDFSTILDLPRGTHHFKFIVDEEWRCSEDLPSAPDEDGHLVNYLEVVDAFGRNMGDGLDDLAEDEAGSASSGDEYERHQRRLSGDSDVSFTKPRGHRLSRTDTTTSDGLGNSPPETYGTEIPPQFYAELNPGQAPPSSSRPSSALGTSPGSQSSKAASTTAASDPFHEPPLPLPPQLEKVVLNQSAAASTRVMDGVDPDFLPVPNHVTLNHLYACSIRDGVMSVAASTRYRKKYVTTVYFKPISVPPQSQ